MKTYETEIPAATCPKCGAEYDDYEEKGVVYCPKCGYTKDDD